MIFKRLLRQRQQLRALSDLCLTWPQWDIAQVWTATSQDGSSLSAPTLDGLYQQMAAVDVARIDGEDRP